MNDIKNGDDDNNIVDNIIASWIHVADRAVERTL